MGINSILILHSLLYDVERGPTTMGGKTLSESNKHYSLHTVVAFSKNPQVGI
jgi:hypothetical protein